MVMSVGAAVTVAVPLLAVSCVDVACTVSEVAVSSAVTVRRPAVEMDVPGPPPVTVHVTVVGGLLVPETVAVKSWFPPLATVAVAGLTVTLVTVATGVPRGTGEHRVAGKRRLEIDK